MCSNCASLYTPSSPLCFLLKRTRWSILGQRNTNLFPEKQFCGYSTFPFKHRHEEELYDGETLVSWTLLQKTVRPLRGRLARDRRQDVILNPITAPACKISRLKMHSSKQYTRWSYNKSTFNAVHFHRNPSMCSCLRDK